MYFASPAPLVLFVMVDIGHEEDDYSIDEDALEVVSDIVLDYCIDKGLAEILEDCGIEYAGEIVNWCPVTFNGSLIN